MTKEEQVVLDTLLLLSNNLSLARDIEKESKEERIAIEEQIAALIPGEEVGQETVTLRDGSKIVVKRGFNYKADLLAIDAIFIVIDADNKLPSPTKTKTTREFDIKGYEWYKEHHSDIFARIAEHVVVTPKKINVTLQSAKEK